MNLGSIFLSILASVLMACNSVIGYAVRIFSAFGAFELIIGLILISIVIRRFFKSGFRAGSSDLAKKKTNSSSDGS